MLEQIDDAFELDEEEYQAKYGPAVLTPAEREHGKFIRREWDAYHDINVYEDGYKEYISIGD